MGTPQTPLDEDHPQQQVLISVHFIRRSWIGTGLLVDPQHLDEQQVDTLRFAILNYNHVLPRESKSTAQQWIDLIKQSYSNAGVTAQVIEVIEFAAREDMCQPQSMRRPGERQR